MTQQSSDMVERVARALSGQHYGSDGAWREFIERAEIALEASHHAELVSVLRELVYGGGGHVWAHARELLAKVGGDGGRTLERRLREVEAEDETIKRLTEALTAVRAYYYFADLTDLTEAKVCDLVCGALDKLGGDA